MKIPSDGDEIPKWLEACRDTLGDVGGHLVKRAALLAKAMTAQDSGDFSTAEYCEKKAGPVFKAAADGDDDANCALCMIASRLLARGKPLPPMLATYASAVLGEKGLSEPSRGRGRHSPSDYATRDLMIVRLIETIRDERGVFATRSEAQKDAGGVASTKRSGCSIVAPLVGMDERAVEEVWLNRKKFLIK
jgi:hypothetical protein